MIRAHSYLGLFVAIGGASLGAGGCGDDAGDDPCEGVNGSCIALKRGATAQEVQDALLTVTSGGTVAFGEGTFSFEVDLSLDVDNVTIKGAGREKTTLSFAGQTTGAQGMLVTANDFRISDLGFEDTKGDALKVLGATGVTIQRVSVVWTRGPDEMNGAYGLYPVQCKKVLIEDSVVDGASDAGFYVGQSEDIIVRNNRAVNNVAGIEIENSNRADVHNNTVTENTGGILVFNLPDLEVANGSGTRVYDNEIFMNNTSNFAPPGNIVGKVPTGTGIALLAAHNVEIFNNRIADHLSVNIGVISYVPIGTTTDADYQQFPTKINIHDNTLTGTSNMPTGELGALLILTLSELNPNPPFVVPDITWDGVVTPANTAADICIRNNGDADFLDLAFPPMDPRLPTRSLTPHDCTHPALPPVSL